jgi:hypothetical protein
MSADIFTAVFHIPPDEPWLGSARMRDLRLATAAGLADVVGLESGVLVLPAGFFRAATPDGCADLANSMLQISEESKTTVVFGADLCPDEEGPRPALSPTESWLFACSNGKPLLWPARPRSSFFDQRDRGGRCIRADGLSAGVLLGSEVFSGSLRKELIRAKPDLICVLTHFGPTLRWVSALDGVSSIAPVVLSGATTTGVVPAWSQAPPGWEREELGGSEQFSLLRYSPIEQAVAITPERLATARRS